MQFLKTRAGYLTALISIAFVALIFSDFLPNVPSGWYQPWFAVLYLICLVFVVVLTLIVGISKPSLFLFIAAVIAFPVGFAELYEHHSKTGQCLTGEAPSGTLYFSYVTYLSLGYGDLAPIGICRIYAIIEGLIGMLVPPAFLASVFASVISQHK